MARALRIEYPNAIYHITSRGNARQAIFLDDRDRVQFVTHLCQTVSRFHWILHSYCLMDNHYHLLVETPEANLSRGMRQLNGIYSQRFNRRHGRVGHVLQGRFHAVLVERESHLLELCRYVVLNPVRAGLVRRAEDWRWSSYRPTVGAASPSPCLQADWVLAQFSNDRPQAVQAYAQFVREGVGAESPWAGLKSQVLLGTARFVDRLRPVVKGAGALREVPRTQRFATRPALESLLKARPQKHHRVPDEQIHRAYVEYGYTMKEISRHLGLHYATISRAVQRMEAEEGAGREK